MSQPSTHERGQEEARQELETRCLEAMGQASPILAKVLSYFPEEAELFIETQDHAAKIEGRRSIWSIVTHKCNKSLGLFGKTIYNANSNEYLSQYGFTGEHLSKSITILRELRGRRGTKDKPYPFGAASTEIDKIIAAYEGEEEIDPMLQKLIEVMEVSEKDINLLRRYSEIINQQEAVYSEIYDLNKKINNLKQEMKTQQDSFAAELEQAYPVQTSSETE